MKHLIVATLLLPLAACGGSGERKADVGYPFKTACAKVTTVPERLPESAPGYRAVVSALTSIASGADHTGAGKLRPVIAAGRTAAKSVGTFEYVDDERSYDHALTRLDTECESVGVNDVITGN